MTGVLHTIYMFDIWRYLYVWWIFFVYFYSIPLWIFAILCILLGVNGKLLFLITLRNFLSWSIWLRYIYIYVCIYCWYMEHEFFDSCSGTNIYFWISFSPAVVSLELFSLSVCFINKYKSFLTPFHLFYIFCWKSWWLWSVPNYML